MVFVNIYVAGNNPSFTFYHGLSGYYKCKIIGWNYVDANTANTSILVGVNINELRIPSNPYTFTFIKNNTTSHYPQSLPPITAQLNQYFTVNLQNISATGNLVGVLTAFTLYMECEEITPNNLISN